MGCNRQYVLLLLQLIFFTGNCFAQNLNLTLNLNSKKPIAVTNDAFLSFTLDPESFLRNIDDFTKNIERSTNMVRGLAPAYVRFAGPQSNAYIFEHADSNDVVANRSSVLSETHWTLIDQWAENAGLDVIACIAPHFIGSESKTHPRYPPNVAEFLAFSDQMGRNISWQLGYECQTRCEFSGGDLGRYVANLRDLLKTYPRYSNSLIIGPDIVAYKTTQQRKYLQDYFDSADDALSAITWHPDFASVSLNNGNISVHYDNLVTEMDEMCQIIGLTAGNKPLWIAESKPEKCKNQYLGALIWTRRLGNAAKLGVQVVMRQPQDLNKATPDYWVSLLHKILVGREVLETGVERSDNDNVHFYSQCTKLSAFYDKGAITIFGLNLTPSKVTANLKGLKIRTLHKYILSPDYETDNKMFSEKVLLNNKPLNLIDDKYLPDLYPEIIIDPDNQEIELSSGDIGFWVIPDAKVNACMHPEEETTASTAAKRLSKRHEDIIQQDGRDKDTSQSNLKSRNAYAKRDATKQKNIANSEDQQGIWNSKLLRRIRKVLQKRLLRKEKSASSDSRRSIKTVLDKEKEEDLPEEEERPSNVNNDHFRAAAGKLEEARDTLKRRKRSLLEEKNQTGSEYVGNAKVEKLGETSRTDDLRKHVVMRNVKRRTNFSKKKLTSDKPCRNCNEDKGRRHRLLRQEPAITFPENGVGTVGIGRRSARQEFKREPKRRRENNTNKRYPTTDDVGDHQDSMQKLERARRQLSRKLTEVSLRKENVHGKRSRVDDARDYPGERRIRKKDVSRREGLLIPFNPRVTEGDENNFYGFFRRDPLDDFPKGDLFVTAGDSLEQNGKDYDYVEDDDDDDDDNVESSKRKNTQHGRMSILGHTTAGTWEEPQLGNDNRDYVPNEFFEKVKLPDAGLKERSKDYGDLWEAQYFSDGQENKGADVGTAGGINNKRNVAEISEVRYKRPDEIQEDRIRETGVHDDNDWDAKHEAAEGKSYSTIFEQFTETPPRTDHRVSHARPEEARLKVNPDSKVSFYQPARVSAARYNYGDYRVSTASYDQAKSSEERDPIVNTPDSRADINTETSNFYGPAEHPTSEDGLPQNERVRRSYWEKLKTRLAREMTEEDENDAKDCHRRVIRRAPDEPKKSRYHRVTKRDDHVPEFSSKESTDVNMDDTRFARDAENLMTKQDYGRIMTGEILPVTSIDNSGYSGKPDAIAETVVPDSSEMDYYDEEDEYATQTSDAVSSSMDSSTMDLSEGSDNAETSSNDSLSADSTSSSEEKAEYIEQQTFFRGQSTKYETTTYDLPPIDDTFYSDNQGHFIPWFITTESPKATRKKKEADVDSEAATESFSTRSTITTNREEEEKGRDEDNHTSSLKTTIFLEGMTEGFAEGTTTETSPLKRAIDGSVGDSRSNETEARREKLQREDNSGDKSEDEKRKTRSKEDARGTRNTLQYLPKAPLRELARIEEGLVKRAGRIDRRKEKLHAKRESLLQQYHQELAQMADEQKRSLKRREIWERFGESDDFRRLIDEQEFIGLLIDNEYDDEYNDEYDDEEDEECDRRHVIPIGLTSKQYDALLDQIYPFARRVRYPKYEGSQVFRWLSMLAEQEQESAESSSRSCDQKIYAIDPSTYYGGEPDLQLHKKFSIPSGHRSQIEPQIQIPRWMLRDSLFQVYSRKSDRDQYPVAKLGEYTRKSPSQDHRNDRKKADVLYVLDARGESNLQKELGRIWLNPIDPRGIIDRRDKAQVASSACGNLEEKHDILDFVSSEKTKLSGDFGAEGNAGDEEFASFHDGKEDQDLETAEDTADIEDLTKNEKFEIMRLSADVHDKEDDTLDIGSTVKDLQDAETMKTTENSDVNSDKMLNTKSRKATAKTRRLNRKSKSIAEDKNAEINKSCNVNEVKENLNIKVSNDNGAVEDVERITDVDPESSKLAKGVTRARRSIKKPTSNKYLEQPPYSLKNNGRNRPNRDVYLKKDSEEMFNKRPVQHIFLRKTSSSIDDDNSLEDFLVPVELSKFLTKKIADLINEYLDDESLEELENHKALLVLGNQLNNADKDKSYKKICSENEQDISQDDENAGINYESKRENGEYGSESEEYSKYSEMKDKIQSYYNPMRLHKRRMVLLIPQRNERRQRRQIENQINENTDQIKRKSKRYKPISAQDSEDESAENHLNDNHISKKEREKIIKIKNTRKYYVNPKMDKRNHDDLFGDFIEIHEKNNLQNKEISFENNILESDRKLSSILEEPTPVSENLIIKPEKTQDLAESVEQSDDNFEEKRKEILSLDEDKHLTNETSEIDSNDSNAGFIEKLFAFFLGIPWISMHL